MPPSPEDNQPSDDEWVFVDAEGNAISPDADEWIYVDDQGRMVSGEVDQEEAPKLKVPKLARPSSAGKELPEFKKGKPLSKPSFHHPPHAVKPKLSAAPVAHHPAPIPVQSQKSKTSLWPLLWSAVMITIVCGVCYWYKNTGPQLPSQPIVEAESPEIEIIEEPIPVALAPEPEVLPEPKPIPVKKTYTDPEEIPHEGLAAHYISRISTTDIDPGRTPDSIPRVHRWSTADGRFTLTSNDNEDRLIPRLAEYRGTNPQGLPFGRKVVELRRNSGFSSENEPFEGSYNKWGMSIVLLASIASPGPLLSLPMAEPAGTSISVVCDENKIKAVLNGPTETTTASIKHADREWQVIQLVWNAELNSLDISSISLHGENLTHSSVEAPGFEFRTGYLKIGPDISTRISDILLYDRPLDESDREHLKKALPIRFFKK